MDRISLFEGTKEEIHVPDELINEELIEERKNWKFMYLWKIQKKKR